MKIQKEGKWTLNEHIKYLQALDKYGINWEKISKIIQTRTTAQIRSHSQKFFKKLKKCKFTELGINFTSENIHNIKDMIEHIKSVNKDFNVATVFFYLSEICTKDKNPKEQKKNININININKILNECVNKKNVNDNIDLYKNENKDNIIDKDENITQQININNFNPINNFIPINNYNPIINYNIINNNIMNNLYILSNYNCLSLLFEEYLNYNFITANYKSNK